ncbi:conjugative transfer protein TraD [mine drainage metagenome]|uniref:Conjugative transfer protein TraD n=1 Tax=mine drainage metagenome TaxID=410659 RepID=T0YF66_9ZZZZ
MIATIQSVAQLERTYGHDTAKVLLSVFASKLVMRQGAAYDAEHWSKEIGEQEVWRSSRSQNTGASGGSSGTTESLHNVRLVLPAELMDLPKFSGFHAARRPPGNPEFRVPFRKVEPVSRRSSRSKRRRL